MTDGDTSVLGLLRHSPDARWMTGQLTDEHNTQDNHDIPWEGSSGDDRGFARLDVVSMEDGNEQHALRTHPKWVSNGTIKGWHPWRLIPEDPIFEAEVGFVKGATNTDGVTFRVFAHRRTDSGVAHEQIARVDKEYNGTLESIRTSVPNLSGKMGRIELRVDAGDSSTQDWAAWIDPCVVTGSGASNTVSAFQPSSCGFYFTNSFPSVPYDYDALDVNGVEVPIGDASNGMCGGMVFAAIDYFRSGLSPWEREFDDRGSAADNTPVSDDSPAPDTDLFDYLSNRLFDSFNLPSGPDRYMRLMNPAVRDTEPTWLPPFARGDYNRSDVMLNAWSKIQSHIDDDRLCPLGLIKVKSYNPFDMGKNHQVLAYGYEQSGRDVSIQVYDPNRPGDDDIQITFTEKNPTEWLEPAYNESDGPLHAFFVVNYREQSPPEW